MHGDDYGEARRAGGASPMERMIRGACMRLGCNLGELARRAGVSRTTLYQLARGRTTRPRPETLSRLAAEMGVTPDELDAAISGKEPDAGRSGAADQRRAFNRRTNTVIPEVFAEFPGLFQSWSENEWDELYSTFGTGGQLTADGIRSVAERINQKKETTRRLQVVLETHYADVATSMIEAMYRAVRPGDNLVPSAELRALLAAHRTEGGQSVWDVEK